MIEMSDPWADQNNVNRALKAITTDEKIPSDLKTVTEFEISTVIKVIVARARRLK